MKKRLRKKRHLKEFTELGFGFECEWIDQSLGCLSDEQEKLLYDFCDFCESNDWDCGGGVGCETFGMVVSKYKRQCISQKQSTNNITLDERDKVFNWLIGVGLFKSVKITDLVDMWNAGDKVNDNPVYAKIWNKK